MENSYAAGRITEALLELMEEVPYEEITVSAIVRRAQVGRASFYRHFDSREAVLRRHMAALLAEWGREYEALGRLDQLGPSLLRHFYRHRAFYLLLYRCGLSHYLLEAIRGAMDFRGKTDREVYVLNWFAGGLYGVVEEWLRRGMTETAEELEEILREQR